MSFPLVIHHNLSHHFLKHQIHLQIHHKIPYLFQHYVDNLLWYDDYLQYVESLQVLLAPVFVSLNLKKDYDVTPIHVDVNIVSNDVLDIEAFKAWRPEYQNAEFIREDGTSICGWAIEKMSKSMFNVVNPDMIVEKYGADEKRSE